MIKQLLIYSSAIFILAILFMYIWQRHLIYFPARVLPNRLDYQAQDMTVVSLHTKDGLDLNAWYKKAKAEQSTVLYLHGNAGHIGFRMPLVREFINAGIGVLLVEYRGYGGNKGSPSEQGLYQDGNAAFKFLQEQGVKSKQIILYGESLGTAVALKMAVESPVCAVILQSPFTSMVNLARYHYPWLIIKPWDRFDSLSRINSIKVPLLILHGKEDGIVPYEEGLTLYKHAHEPKKMVQFEHGNHNNLWGYSEFSREVIHYIETTCP
jgi:hypothetical protein